MSDRAIIQQVLAGDVEAFAQIVDRHYARCARIAVRIVGNREDAEEAIQDAFAKKPPAVPEAAMPSFSISIPGSSISPSTRTMVRARGRSSIEYSIGCPPTSERRSC